MRTSAYSWKKNPKVSQRSQKGLLRDTSPKLKKKQFDFPGMDLQSSKNGKKGVGVDVINIQQTSQIFHILNYILANLQTQGILTENKGIKGRK